MINIKIILIVISLLFVNACTKYNNDNSKNKDIYINKNVLDEIRRIIDNNNFSVYKNISDSIPKVLAVYVFNSPQNECKMIISIEAGGIDSTRFCGYVEIEHKPVAFYILSDDCAGNLLNKELLEKSKETIPKKSSLFNRPDKPFIYELPTCVYSIKNDSLILESSSFMNLGFKGFKTIKYNDKNK